MQCELLKILSMNTYVFAFLLLFESAMPIQLQQGEELKENSVETSDLNECLSVRRGNEVGVCFGKELLSRLNNYDEKESFSLANGISFVRDEKTERTLGGFLDKDPMDFRSIMEDASDLISKRSLHWDMGGVYPGLVMRIGPTLANGVLEFVIDPRSKDRAYQPGEVSTGRLLARNVLVPFLLGLKFHISTLLPLLLGLLLLASKKAFFLAKIALIAVTLFSGGSGYSPGYLGGLGGVGGVGGFGPTISSYSHENLGYYHGHHGGGFYRDRHTYAPDPYPDKLESTASPITPDELRDRLERLFVTKKEEDREEKIRNARNFAWTPINAG